MANVKTLERNEIAAAMGCKKATTAISRLVALGYYEHCERCGGCGRYSWNQINGDTCFGCGGSGKKLARITAETVTEALARIAAGELDAYFAENKARKEIKAAHESMFATYMSTASGKQYSVASRGANAAAFLQTPLYRVQELKGRVIDHASAALYNRKAPYAERIAIIRAAQEMLLEIERAWGRFTGAVS